MYRQKVRPPWWVWALVFMAAFSIGIAIGAAFGGNSDLIATAISLLIFGRLVASSTVTIEVDSENLIVGQATLPRRFIGSVRALSSEEAREMRGPKADPAAYLVLRGWISKAVIVTNTDTDDPVPYWFISTSRPEELATALKP